MAAATDPIDYATPDIRVGPKLALAAFYIVIALIAMAVALPLAFMTADRNMFDECYGAPEICDGR